MIDRNLMRQIQVVEHTRDVIKRWVKGQCWEGMSENEIFNKISDFSIHRLITDLHDQELAEVITQIAKDVVKENQKDKTPVSVEVTQEDLAFIDNFAADTFKSLLKESMKDNILTNGLYERLSKEAYEAAKIFYQVRKGNLKDAV